MRDRQHKKEYDKEYYNRPEIKEKIKKYKTIWAREYRKRPGVMARMVQRNRNQVIELKRIIFNHYGNKCNCCSETEPKFLTIDHVNNDGNIHRKKIHPGEIFYRYIIRNNFPPEFQLLCMNCNFGKRMNNGICPHKKAVK